MQVVGVFAEVMLPVLLVAAVGGLAARRLAIPVKSLADLVFFVFSPALVFVSIAEIELAGGEIARIVAVVVTASALGLDGTVRAAVLISSAMPTAVMVTILAAQLGGRADLAVRAVVVSTLLSVVTLTTLITVVT
jgi:predicted permease